MNRLSPERILWNGAAGGVSEDVILILKNHPLVDVNWKFDTLQGTTALHQASFHGHSDIVTLLLAHPGIDVNQRDTQGSTAFMLACKNGKAGSVWPLALDPRVLINEKDRTGFTPLLLASADGYLDIVKLLIASEKPLYLGCPGNFATDAIGEARINGQPGVVKLLERFKRNPVMVVHEVQLELQFGNAVAAEVFALVVFLCDDLLQIKDTYKRNTKRFFLMAMQLPMELQMVLSHRVAGSMRNNVAGKHLEPAARSLTKKLLR